MPRQRIRDDVYAPRHMQHAPGSRHPRIHQLPRQHAVVALRQHQPHLVELAALRLVHGHRERAVVRRQCGGVERARVAWVVAGKPRHQGAAVVAQTDADVAVEQTVAVAVFGDQEQAAVEVAAGGGRGAGAAAGAGEEVFDAGVEGTGALRAFADGGEDAQAGGAGEGVGGVGGFGERGPVGEEVVAVGLQGVGVVFVEVDAGEVGGAEQDGGGCCVDLSYGGGVGGGVGGTGALRAFADGGEDAQAGGAGEGVGGVGGFGERGPVGEEVVAVGLQGVGVVFVEVDAGEVGGAEQEEGGCCVALAYGGGEGGEVEGGALAVAAG